MDPAIDQIIAGFRTGIQSFQASLGADHPKVKEAAEALAQLEATGEQSADVMAFMEAAGGQMDRVGTLLAGLASAKPEPSAGASAAPAGATPGAAATPSVPTAQQVALGHHLAYDQLDKNNPANQGVVAVYQRIFEIENSSANAAEFNRRMAEEGLLARLSSVPHADSARHTLSQIREHGLAQPCMEYHYARVAEAMDRATSAAEVEYEANLLVEYNSAENEWDTLFCHYALKAIGEVAGYYMDKSPAQQQNVEVAYRFVADFFGRDWDSMWSCPRVWQQWCMLFEKSKSTWTSERQCHTAEQARDFHTRTFIGIMNNRNAPVESVPVGPAVRQGGFRLWSQEVHMDQLLGAYQSPARPPVDFSG